MERPPPPPAWLSGLPNALSFLRLGIGLAFAFVPPAWRVPCVLVGAASDGLDGWIARRWRVTSIVGGLLDALADKAFALGVLVTLLCDHLVTWHEVLGVVARDLVVLAVVTFFLFRRQWVAFEGMPSRISGKATTVLLFAWFLALLTPAPHPVRLGPFALTALASVWAAGDYLREFLRTLRDGRVHVYRRQPPTGLR